MTVAISVPHHQILQTFTLQNAATANGNGTSAAVGGLSGAQMVEIANAGTGTCTVLLQGSYDGTNWYNLGFQQVDNTANPTRTVGTIAVGATTWLHVYQILDLYTNVRAVIASTSGTIAVTAKLNGVAI